MLLCRYNYLLYVNPFSPASKYSRQTNELDMFNVVILIKLGANNPCQMPVVPESFVKYIMAAKAESFIDSWYKRAQH